MQQLTLDIEAGRLSQELVRRGVAAKTRVRAVVEILDEYLPLAAAAAAGRAFEFLAEEPDIYTDADLIQRNK